MDESMEWSGGGFKRERSLADLVGEPEKSLQVEIPFQRGFYRLDMIASRHGVLHGFAPAGRA